VDLTARMMAARKARELGVVMRVVAGVEEVLTVVGAHDQLLCLPEPFMPTKGFSWARKHEVVPGGEAPHRAHDDHVVI